LHDLDHHFRNRDAVVREIYDRLATAVQSIGPVIILPEKTRIAFQVPMSFAQVTPRQKWLHGHVGEQKHLRDDREASRRAFNGRRRSARTPDRSVRFSSVSIPPCASAI
jgi:hypothetical protein